MENREAENGTPQTKSQEGPIRQNHKITNAANVVKLPTHPKRKSDRPNNEKNAPNDYYLKQSERFRHLKIACIILLISFVVCMVVFFRDSITIENLQYFLRFIDTKEAVSDEISTVKYDSSSVTDFAMFKGGLLVLDPDKVELYGINGENILSVTHKNAEPVCATGASEFLVYNIGGYSYQIYNSLASIFEETYEYPISCAAINDAGMYLIGTKTMEFRSVVYIYNKSFERIYQWSSPDKYLMSADLRADGKQFIIASLMSNADGTCSTVVSLYGTDEEQAIAEVTLPGCVPVSMKYNKKGGAVLVTDSGIHFFDKQLEKGAFVSYDGYVPVRADTTGEYSYFALNKNVVGSEHEVTLMNRNGSILFSGGINGEITDCTISGGLFYFLMERQIVCVDPATDRITAMEVSAGGIRLGSTENDLLICKQGGTEILSIAAFHKNAR